MDRDTDEKVSLISRWFLRPAKEKQGWEALKGLAREVEAKEPNTLAYLVHTPLDGAKLQSLPPSDPTWVEFFEIYRNAQAFDHHVNGEVFTKFVDEHGALFVPNDKGEPFTTVLFMSLQAGFARLEALPPEQGAPT